MEHLNEIIPGDCIELSHIIPDNSIDLVLTDPPFGIDFKYPHYKDSKDGYLDLVAWIIKETNRVLKPGALAFVWQASIRLKETWPLFPEDSRLFAACKNWIQLRKIPVNYGYDPVIFWKKDGAYIKEMKGRDWHVGNTSPSSYKGLNKVDFHPCPRPLDTLEYMVQSFSPENGIVLDWFMGSGTTAVASRELGRSYIGFEIDREIASKAQQRADSVDIPEISEQILLDLR